MNKNIYLMVTFCILIVTIIGFVSASEVRITPDHISISGYSGETIQQNITIFVDEPRVICLNVSKSSEVSINSTCYMIINNLTIPVDFTISPIADNNTFSLFLESEYYNPEVFSNVGTGGGGGYYMPKNETKNQTTNIIKPIENQTICATNITSNNSCPIIQITKNYLKWVDYVIGAIILIVGILYLFIKLNSLKYKK